MDNATEMKTSDQFSSDSSSGLPTRECLHARCPYMQGFPWTGGYSSPQLAAIFTRHATCRIHLWCFGWACLSQVPVPQNVRQHLPRHNWQPGDFHASGSVPLCIRLIMEKHYSSLWTWTINLILFFLPFLKYVLINHTYLSAFHQAQLDKHFMIIKNDYYSGWHKRYKVICIEEMNNRNPLRQRNLAVIPSGHWV